MKNRSLPVAAFLMLTCFFVFSAAAQETSKVSAPQNLVLEVTYFKGRPIAGLPLAINGKSGSAWYSLFQRSSEFNTSARALPVRAVNVVPQMDGETARVRISVFIGEKSFDKEEFVAEYSINENEKIIVKELSKFGVEPFELAVVSKALTVAILPDVLNTSNWLRVSIEPNYSTMSSFKLIVTNTSNKAVEAFSFETSVGNRRMVSGMPRDLKDFPLIEPGKTYETIVPIDLDVVKQFAPRDADQSANPNITIKNIIYSDGSYEGALSEAASYFALKLGTKSLIEKVILLLEKTLTQNATASSADLLAEEISYLKETVDETGLDELSIKFPALGADGKNRIHSSAHMGFRINKLKVVAKLKDLREKETVEAPSVGIKNILLQYRDRLKRLSK